MIFIFSYLPYELKSKGELKEMSEYSYIRITIGYAENNLINPYSDRPKEWVYSLSHCHKNIWMPLLHLQWLDLELLLQV